MAEGRRGVHEAAAASASDFHAELGQAYVSPHAARESQRVLDPERRRALSAWADTLIPANEHWPSAADVDAVGYIDRTVFLAPALRPIVLRGIDRLEARVVERREVLSRLEQLNPDGVFELVLELVFEAYYRDERVVTILEERTGFSMQRAMRGWEMQPFDESLLDRVRALPPRYRALAS
ncbi:MAG: gluconate 2-dehydrogenase subunit 3 family protein [Actinobacteria bacterium]|nr:MAG: gluconate 2-dehydrogenase subunit 3 family protein [Actinomycetota bacterium]